MDQNLNLLLGLPLELLRSTIENLTLTNLLHLQNSIIVYNASHN